MGVVLQWHISFWAFAKFGSALSFSSLMARNPTYSWVTPSWSRRCIQRGTAHPGCMSLSTKADMFPEFVEEAALKSLETLCLHTELLARSLSTNLSFVVLGGNMSSSLIGMLPWNPYWNKTQTLTFEMKVCSGARVVLWWSRRQWNPRPWDGNHCDGGCQQKDNGTCTRSFWCFPSRENELILTLFMRNLVVFVTKGKCAKMGNFIGFPPIKRER